MFNKINSDPKFKFRMLSAAFSWALLAGGIYYFGVLTSTGVMDSLIRGALFGLTTYGIYNATNYATIKKYSSRVAMVDTIWGICLCAMASVLFRLVSAGASWGLLANSSLFGMQSQSQSGGGGGGYINYGGGHPVGSGVGGSPLMMERMEFDM